MLSKQQPEAEADALLKGAVEKLDRVRTARFPELLAFPVQERPEQLRIALSRAWRNVLTVAMVAAVVWLIAGAAVGLWLGWRNAGPVLGTGLAAAVLLGNVHRAQTRRQLKAMQASRAADIQERSASG